MRQVQPSAEANLQHVPVGVGQQFSAVLRHQWLVQEEVTEVGEDHL
jgi:hypothetical protein